MKFARSAELKQFNSMPWWYKSRGIIMIVVGAIVSVLCLVAPKVYMLGESFSWLPVIGIVTFIVGVFRCIDAFICETPQGFLLNMQGGIVDCVVGLLVLFSINEEPVNLNLLVIAYLIIQGIYRNVLLSAANISNPFSNRVTGFISISMAIVIWIYWPTNASWFLALVLSIEIIFRGWALIVLASSIKKQLNWVG